MRSPYSRFQDEEPAKLGHNLGPPLESGYSWRVHCWRRARKEIAPRPPLEVLRRRVRRAKELGLAYPEYASILLGSGRDVAAFLITAEAIGMQVLRSIRLDEAKAEKLAGVEKCALLLLTPAEADAATCAAVLAEAASSKISGAGPAPTAPGSNRMGAAAIRAILDPLKLPSASVVMIGDLKQERDWADAAQLAKFLTADRFFGANPEGCGG